MAIFGLTSFLLVARPCRVVRTKKKQKCVFLSPKTSDTVNGLSKHNCTDLWDRGSMYINK